MAYLELEVPDEPPTNYYVRAILGTFYLADRGRNFLSGMTISPRYITVKDITEVLEAHPVYIDRRLLDHCIFSIDALYMAESRESMNKKDDSNQD